jgi:hypothetical protein
LSQLANFSSRLYDSVRHVERARQDEEKAAALASANAVQEAPKLVPEPSPPTSTSQELLEESRESQPAKKRAKVVKMLKAKLPLNVTANQSKQEVWSENFQKIKEFFYEEK